MDIMYWYASRLAVYDLRFGANIQLIPDLALILLLFSSAEQIRSHSRPFPPSDQSLSIPIPSSNPTTTPSDLSTVISSSGQRSSVFCLL